MEAEHSNYKLIAATALGALGGLLLAGYLYRAKQMDSPLSKHVAALSKVLEQIEGADEMDVENLKERIERLLISIEKNYGNTEE